MIWSARQLKVGYQRQIIGFDLRLKGEAGQFFASVDCQIWPRSIQKKNFASQCNGFNFLDQIDDKIKSAAKAEDTVIVAFDIPKNLADSLLSTFGLILFPIELVSLDKAWYLMGFDIVDIRTQCSAFYSFEYSKSEREQILQKLSVQSNAYGLVQSEFDAIGTSNAIDKILPEHSPFTPCGVWIQLGAAV